MAEAEKSTAAAAGLACPRCGNEVGVIWYRGRSTVLDSIKGGEGNLIIAKVHQCGGQVEKPPRNGRPRR